MKNITKRQNEIIMSALEIIAERGIQELTIKNLSKSMGFTEAALYRHFDNKIQILTTILDYFQDSSKLDFDINKSKQLDPEQIIYEVFIQHFRKFSETPSIVSVIFADDIFKNEQMLSDKINNIMQSNIKKLSEVIKFGQKNGIFRSDISNEHAALIILGSLRLFVKNWQNSCYSFNLENEGTLYMNSLLNLFKKNIVS
ncbi:MAG: hypothetical protein A2X64_10020 [Ignavibacteria bacterium GWF2_33_9]|nr:MAG: hypothetical protein A2X64_10020 [Ignavibacteria bacterium GWF2_33_9]